MTKVGGICALLAAGGCETFGYYTQAIGGQLELSRSGEPVQAMLADSATPELLRKRLVLAGRVVDFSRSELGFDAGDSYRRYVALERPYVAWNLFAAPPLSLDGRRWCYPVVGCVPYRGYFSERAALRAEARLARSGQETHVAGVAAYSSLGWFNDPLLSTFIDWPEPRFVELLVHELAHRRVWIADDVAFNESFAEFAGEEGARRWYGLNGRTAEHDAYRAARSGWRRLRTLLLETRARLESIYRQGGADALRQREKTRVLESLRRCYLHHKPLLGGGSYDRLVREVNNAYLFALGTYTDWRPALAALLRKSGSWTDLLRAVDDLATLGRNERRRALLALNAQSGAVNEEIEPVRCESRQVSAVSPLGMEPRLAPPGRK